MKRASEIFGEKESTPIDPPKEILSESESAPAVGVVGHTLCKWRQLGIGPDYLRLSGRCVRYRREDLLRWLESRRAQPKQ
jgi:predicted DNA-binding transcriptional regulator AlpA